MKLNYYKKNEKYLSKFFLAIKIKGNANFTECE